MNRDILNSDDLNAIVIAFYDQIREHESLGPYFGEVVPLDWDIHLSRMTDFWDNVVFHSGQYKGQPMEKHFHLNEMKPLSNALFKEWVRVFHATIDGRFSGSNAEKMKASGFNIANLICMKMNLGVFVEIIQPDSAEHSSNQ